MQTEVLDVIPDPSLRAYVAWVPVLPADNEAAAWENQSLVTDVRALHFWDVRRSLAGPFARVLGLPEGWPAWDVYLAFAAGARWEAEAPRPSFWHHQLGDEPHAPKLDGARFREQVQAMVQRSGAG